MRNKFQHSTRKTQPFTINVRLQKQNKRTIKPFWKEIWHGYCKHPTPVSLLLPLFGGLIILIYLLPLGFLPDFNLSEIIGLLVVVALLGLFSLIVIGSILLWPATLHETLYLAEKSRQRRGIETLLIFCLFPFFVISGYFLRHPWTAGILIFMLLLFFLVFLPITCQKKTETSRKNAQKYFYLILAAGVNFLSASFVFIPAAMIGLENDPPLQQWGALIAWYTAVAFFNTILIQEKEKNYSSFLMAGMVLIGFLIILTKTPIYIHTLATQKLKMGNIQEATITVNASASAVLQAACQIENKPFACNASQNNEENSVYRNVTILSRLGNQYYLELCQSTDTKGPCEEKGKLRVVINKKDVLGWSIQEKGKN